LGKIHLVHGIRTGGPAQAPELLIPYLKASGFDVRYPDYGFELEIETRFVNAMIVGAIQPYIDAQDICIGHSNGCAIIYELMARKTVMAGAVFINGALTQNLVRPAWVPWIDVYWNAGDEITEVAKFGASIGIFDHDWGELGHAGYAGADPAVININCGRTPNLPAVSGHSDIFTKLYAWGPAIAERINAHAVNIG
jgi:hypothetical protein